jgi:hypothetical protein
MKYMDIDVTVAVTESAHFKVCLRQRGGFLGFIIPQK